MELVYGSLDYKKIVKQLIDLLEEKHIKTNSDGKKYIMFWLISSNPYFIVNQYQIYRFIFKLIKNQRLFSLILMI